MLRAPEFEVVMMDGTAVNATVVGLDLRSDVAVLRLGSRGAPFPHLPLGDPGRVQIGDWVISVGAPLGLEGTVVAGVITARPEAAGATALAGYLQSDAVMARGNAGGPLVDMNGQLVGIGTIVGGDESAYAIPAKTLRRIALELLEFGRARRPWLGITTQSLDARLAHAFRLDRAVGALVSNVVAGGPGATAGLRPGDIVVGVGTIAIATRLQFERALATHSPGDVVTLKLSRAGRPLVLSATSSEDPQDLPPPPDAARAKRRLGIDVRALNPTAGAVVRDIEPSSPAGLAGILSGDVIHEVDGKPIRSPADFRAVTRTLTPDAPVLMRVQRRDVVLFVVVSGAHRWTEVGDARRRAER
jgi:serine protease Do